MGIATLGELVALPGAAFRKRLGQTATEHLERMIGERVDPQAWITPDIRFESSLFFTDNITSQKALLFPVRRLIQELTLFLTIRQLWTDSFTLTLSYRNKKQADIQVNLAQPDNDETLFLRLFQTRLENGLSSKETDQVSLKACYFYPADPDNRSLFDQTLLDSNSWARGDLKEHHTQDQSGKHSGSHIAKDPPRYQKKRTISLAYSGQSLVIMLVMAFLLKMIIALRSLGKKQSKLALVLHRTGQCLKDQTIAPKGDRSSTERNATLLSSASAEDYRANIFLLSIPHFAI